MFVDQRELQALGGKARITVRDASDNTMCENSGVTLYSTDSFGCLTFASLARSERKKGAYFELESDSNRVDISHHARIEVGHKYNKLVLQKL